MHNPVDHEHDHETEGFEGFTIEEIKKNFKSLGQELEKPSEDTSVEVPADEGQPFFRGYIPTIKDYLERASTHEECQEIIDYCLQQGEITDEEAANYRQRLKLGGPRAFGSRGPGYYDQKL
ncbi:MAG: DUF2095 family protein [Candidatus Kariarchaeaceae archaeon]|jgi:hypothetical protein